MSLPVVTPYQPPLPSAEARAPWSLDPARCALLVHDLQAYFLKPFPENSEPLQSLLARTAQLLCLARLAQIPVLFSAQPANQTMEERGLLQRFWGSGIVGQEELAELHPALARRPSELLIAKKRYSAFCGTELADELRRAGKDQLILVGVYAHIGVLATALEGFALGFEPFVVSDATADFSLVDHERALLQLQCTCGVAITCAKVAESLSPLAATRLLRESVDGCPAHPAAEDLLTDLGVDSIRALGLFERLATHGRILAFEEATTLRSYADLVRVLEQWP